MTRRLSLRRKGAADPAPGAEPPVTAPAAVPDATPPPSGAPAVDPAAPAKVPPSAATAVHAAVPDRSAVGPERKPADAPGAPSFRDRSRLRRRLRYLRRVRELGFRDLGGLVFDLHRFGREGSGLIAGKLGALAAVDVELRALETVLDDRQEYVVLREPGIAACPRCAALHGSDAHFCPNCGLRLDGPQAIAEVVTAPAGAPAAPPTGDRVTVPSAGDATRPGPELPSPSAPPEDRPTGSLRAFEAGARPAASATDSPAREQPAPVEPGPGAVEQSTETHPAVEPGAEPGRSPQAP